MCGVVAIAGTDVSRHDVDRVADALPTIRHRGPDAEGVELITAAKPGTNRAAVLGAVRLRILDVSDRADQPMRNADGSLTIAYNGEIYNCGEIRADLRAAGYQFRTTSDTECLIHLYDHVDGDLVRMLRRLRGMFAFVMWDSHRARLVAARDRVGIKPMLWSWRNGRLTCASELRAFAGGLVESSLVNVDAVRSYMQWGVVTGSDTIIHGIHRLPAASYLEWDGGEPVVSRWWEVESSPDTTFANPESAQRALIAVLDDSVQRHLVADRSVGLFLSSGTDSAVVAHLAARHGSPRAITVTFPEVPEANEGPDAAGLATRLGIPYEEVPVGPRDAEDALDAFVADLDQPSSDAMNTWLVSRAAHEAGLVVALSGLGGDELFCGYRSFALVPRVHQLHTLARVAPLQARRWLARQLAQRQPGGRAGRILDGGHDLASAYRSVRELFSDADLARFGFDPGHSPDETLSHGQQHTVTDDISVYELDHYLGEQLLPDTDIVSMAHSLEVRVPLIDDNVVSIALAIPGELRRRFGKHLLLQTVGVDEPPRKRAFTLPYDHWLRGPLGTRVEEAVRSDALPFAALLDQTARNDLWDAYLAGRTHWSRVWAVAILRLWAERHGHDL